MLDKEEYIERFKFFRDVQIWPDTESFNFNGWLGNFETDNDKMIAFRLINFFNYYPKKMVDQMLVSAVGHSGFKLAEVFPDWKHSHFLDRCFYSFIPGETQNPSDSGNLFMRKLRDHLGVNQNRFIDYSYLHDFLIDNSKERLPIIFVDDFVGSGSQCYNAWVENVGGRDMISLIEISESLGHVFVYCPLIVNYTGYKFLSEYCNGLIISPAHILGPEYNIFNKECICWNNDSNLYDQAMETIFRYSTKLGIPFSNGSSVKDVRGFGEQGLAIAFEHGAPDAIPPIFYWSDDWVPLINKRYER